MTKNANSVFGDAYAGSYDLLYVDKDYKAECDMLERAFRQYGNGRVQSVLDLGCGTGNHAIPMIQRGYDVVGVDRSGAMLARAREKAAGNLSPGKQPELVEHDVSTLELGRKFDAATLMFNVLGYLTEEDDLDGLLRAVSAHLESGGLFICDFWLATAVRSTGPESRHRVLVEGPGTVIRLTDTSVDAARRICDIRFRLWRLEGDRVLGRTDEVHRVRFFDEDEIKQKFQDFGLTLLRLGAFPEFERDAKPENGWTVTAIASRQ